MSDETTTLKINGGTHYDHESDTYLHTGDVAELDASLLERYPHKFDEVNMTASTVGESGGSGDNSNTSPGDDNDDGGAVDGFDAEAFVERTPWNAVTSDINSGGYDDVLDEIKAAEQSNRQRDSVLNAIMERQA